VGIALRIDVRVVRGGMIAPLVRRLSASRSWSQPDFGSLQEVFGVGRSRKEGVVKGGIAERSEVGSFIIPRVGGGCDGRHRSTRFGGL
jgi:hypothetical protein